MSDPIQTASDIAKATEEVAKTTGQVVEATTRLGTFVAKYIGGPLQLASGIVEDKLKYMRWENQLDLMVRADRKLAEIGLPAPTRTIPPKFAIPLLQAASLEDDADIRDLWATLLVNYANANSGVDLSAAYISILRDLTPLDARILQAIYALSFEETQHQGVLTGHLPEQAQIRPDGSRKSMDILEPTGDVRLSLANLERLGCLTLMRTMGGGQLMDTVNPTYLGAFFVAACTLPSRNAPKGSSAS
ncbi:Abi-alpha family protein [Burkholderia cepacia]|uniref:Abi-alpha family protein n=1 Tax=Burkholderia cepacia TaxID=292 RepID=UPI0018C6F7B1|nr:Abi-alpha family protein [Burkholderia cepacia]